MEMMKKRNKEEEAEEKKKHRWGTGKEYILELANRRSRVKMHGGIRTSAIPATPDDRTSQGRRRPTYLLQK